MNRRMTNEQLERARRLSDGCTQPGPWKTRKNADGEYMVEDANGFWVANVGLAPRDASFIAAARTLVPELIAEIERLRSELYEPLP